MNKDKMKEALARIDGRTDKQIVELKIATKNQPWMNWWDYDELYYPHPTEGYVHLHRIINAMDDDAYVTYSIELMRVCCRDKVVLHKATVLQMAEAILKAYGQWEEE